MSDTEGLAALGKQLREDIDHEFIRLDTSRALKFMGNGRNDITDIVLKYIQVGSSMDRAETLLKHAGFTLRPRGKSSIIPGDISVVAEIKTYKQLFFGSISVIVILDPINKDDYSTVTGVLGGIIAMMI